jgi:O-antigen/teichoic acid export membrane protein
MEKKSKVKENQKQRAYLNSLTSIIDQFSKQVIGFFVSPIIFKGLGSNFYGVYQIVLELTGYANLADAQSTQVLKWTLAKNRNVSSEIELRSEISTGLYIVFFTLPIILIIGSLLSWFSPYIVKIEPEYVSIVRIATSIIVFAIVIEKFSNFFESILRGMNLGFKGLGVRTILIFFSGLGKVAVIQFGFGLIGLMVLQVFLGILTGFIFFYLVKKNIPWFGFGKTNKSKIISYTKVSGWFMATKIVGMLLFHSEKILLGFFIGPQLVAVYVLTLFTSSAMKGILDSVISGVIPGIGTFFGKGEFEKIQTSRLLINNLVWFISFSVGTSILLFNNSFLNLWVGEGNYAGPWENLLILLIAIQNVLFFTTGNFINVTLDLKTKVYLTGLGAFISIAMASILIPIYGILGLCISVLIGRSILSIGFPLILNKKMNFKASFLRRNEIRSLIVSITGFVVVLLIGDRYIFINNWFSLISSIVLTTLLAGTLFWFIGIEAENRRLILEQIKKVKIFKVSD